ncbi:mRNA-capping enzyme [Schistosoma japonicum]|uniref:mRNA-capping enzyme n=2 Tax=Schistosoma japonicum TaxID=6182 RepID=A0A4Z2D5J9_SCHJA|nr:mRNA-capping enzyme [Schistosoma japonicum]
MSDRRIPMLPPRWLKCPRMGDMILDIFIPFKTPLDNKFDHFIDPEDIFHVDDAFKTAGPYKLGLIIDLTKSHRFYSRREVTEHDCKYLKIECKGNEERPTLEQVNLFIQVVNQFLDNNPGNHKIGVHCTHGFNRTGFMIVAYLVGELNYGVDIAVQIFADARPPGIYKTDYLEDLFTRYGCIEDCPPAPPLPDWCAEDGEYSSHVPFKRKNEDLSKDFNEQETVPSKTSRLSNYNEESVHISIPSSKSFPPPPQGNPDFMEGVSKVDVLAQDSPEAHEARDLADRLCKMGGFVYLEGQLFAATDSTSENEQESTIAEANRSNKLSRRPLRFKGSQPVSITQRNIAALVNSDYCVSYKADGTRYLMLIMGPDRVYLIDRGNFVYKPNVLHFPTVSWIRENEKRSQSSSRPDFLNDPNGHLVNTLLDGELVLCHDHSKPPNISTSEVSGTPRFLIYDMITLNNKPIGRLAFFERYSTIDKQVIWPRNTGGHLGLVDFGIQSFSVRRKAFRALQDTEELLKPAFLQSLDHAADGLIFQPCGPEDFYVLGTCPQTLKWKPPSMNTIDFRCKVEYQRKVGEIPGYIGHLFLGGLTVPSAKLAHVSSRDKILDGKIVECVCVPGVGWKVLRVRTDKTEPNYHKSGVGTFLVFN